MDRSAGVGINGVGIDLRCGARVLGVLLLCLIGVSCGDEYRPVAVPIVPPQPDPAALHFMLVLSDNGPNDPGAGSELDVSGDTNIGVAQVGLSPSHATLIPNGARLYVTNSAEDSVSSYSPTSPGSVTTISLPAGADPVFVHSTENNTVYVANFGNKTVAAISTATNVVLSPLIVVGTNPVALAETPDQKKLYVANQGDGDVSSISLVDRSVVQTIPTGGTPVWTVARSDSARVYVLNGGSGTVSAIDTATDTLLSNVAVGAGANFMLYDGKLNRLYVTNPTANTLTALSVAADPPAVLFTLPVAASPVTVAALPDGTRAYVASVSSSGGTAISQVTVVNASDGSVRTVIPLASVAASCASARFELFTAASADSSKVYVGNCDARNTSIIRTSDDTKVLDMAAPLSAVTPPNGGNPLPQNPVFVLAGP
ncbi:MAG: YncE family protein [Terriglobales bacterium]